MTTNELRTLVKARLDSVFQTYGTKSYYMLRPESDMYPHAVFDFGTTDESDLWRRDSQLEVEIYDKQTVWARIEDIADAIEEAFHMENLPQENILPTFYSTRRITLEDPDPTIKHVHLEFEIQNYRR